MKLLIDVHAHLDHQDYKDDLDSVIKRAKESGVKVIIQNGLNPKTNRISLKLAKKYDIIKPALGLYPTDALQIEIENGEYEVENEKFDVDEELKFIEKNKNNIIAIGEVGLDYKWIKNKCKEQKETFKKIIKLAEKIEKPIIVHSRKAEEDVIELLEASKLKNIIMHCFGGNFKLVKRIIDNGWNFSIPTNIVKNQHFQKIVSECPIRQILTETDAPFLSPERGTRNEPKNIEFTIKKIAEIKGLTQEDTQNLIFMNYQRIFL